MSDDILWIEAEDPEMARAIRAAQGSFPEFARQAELEHFRIVPAFETIAIKAFFPDPARPGYGEHMFVTDISTDGKSISGILASEPGFASDLKEGGEVSFPIPRLSDWFLVSGGKGIGGFTIDVLRDRFPEGSAQGIRRVPAVRAWYRHREGTSGESTEAGSRADLPEMWSPRPPLEIVSGRPLRSLYGRRCALRCRCPSGVLHPLIRPRRRPATNRPPLHERVGSSLMFVEPSPSGEERPCRRSGAVRRCGVLATDRGASSSAPAASGCSASGCRPCSRPATSRPRSRHSARRSGGRRRASCCSCGAGRRSRRRGTSSPTPPRTSAASSSRSRRPSPGCRSPSISRSWPNRPSGWR